MFTPGTVWNDVDGRPIDAHLGGILYDDGTYYWYGMRFESPMIPANTLPGQRFTWCVNRGVSIYSSKDLVGWKCEGAALGDVHYHPNHPLGPLNLAVRPKVIRNGRTGKYVMMAALTSPDFDTVNDVVVAVADSPVGPFEFKGKLPWAGPPNRTGLWNRVRPSAAADPSTRIRGFDMTLWAEDARGYLITAHDEMWLYELSEDYLSVTSVEPMTGAEGEAPALFKCGGTYTLLTSRLTGWKANQNTYFTSSSIRGPWEARGPFAEGPCEQTTFDSQVTFVLRVRDRSDAFIFMADRVNATSIFEIPVLSDSTHVWLPIELNRADRTMRVIWRDRWDLSVFGER